MKASSCLFFGLLGLVSGGAERARERETNDGSARTLKGSKGSLLSAAKGGKGMTMEGGKGGGMGMAMTMDAPTSKSKKANSSKAKISVPTAPPTMSASTGTEFSIHPVRTDLFVPALLTLNLFRCTKCKPAPPTRVMSTAVTLNPYEIAYVIVQTDIPTSEEIHAAVNATKQYLYSTFDVLYPSMTGFETMLIATNFVINAPYEIEYRSTIRLEMGSAVPSLDDLNAQLQEVFTLSKGAYLASLARDLDPENIFGTWSGHAAKAVAADVCEARAHAHLFSFLCCCVSSTNDGRGHHIS